MTSSAHGSDSRLPRIALIGFRGCGKTTVGRELAKRLAATFADTDEVVVDRAGKPITQIFADEGEPGFREREREAVVHVCSMGAGVIAVGGGAVLDAANVETLSHAATIVYLTAPAELLWRRISSDEASAKTRPPLTDRSGLDEVEQLLAERCTIYEGAADLTIETSSRTPVEVAEAIVAEVSTRGNYSDPDVQPPRHEDTKRDDFPDKNTIP